MFTKEPLKGNRQKKTGERQVIKGKVVCPPKKKLINGNFM